LRDLFCKQAVFATAFVAATPYVFDIPNWYDDYSQAAMDIVVSSSLVSGSV